MSKVLCSSLKMGVLTALFLSSASASESYEYDALGRLIRVAYDSGKEVNYCYDVAGNRQFVVVGDSSSESIIHYNCDAGSTVAATPFDGVLVAVPLLGISIVAIPNQ